jgi:predicted dehydrogenase
MHSRDLDVGLVGCGRWGSVILRDLNALGCRVHVVARSEASRERAVSAASVVGTVAELPEVGGVVVATSTSSHAAAVGEALERRVPVFCEKPLSDDLDAAERLVAAGDGRLFTMDKWRYHPGVEEIARMVKAGELGTVQHLATVRVGWGTKHDDVDCVWVLAPHDLAIAREILGHVPAPRTVTIERLGARRVGMTATLGGPPFMTMTVSAAAAGHRREVRVIGDEAVAILDGAYANELVVGVPGTEPEHRPIADDMPLLAELRTFVEHLEGGPPPRSSAQEGLEIVAAITALGELE